MEKTKTKKVLVTGASGRRGRKVLEFLKNRGFMVFGADRFPPEQDIKGITRFFKLNLKHRDSIWLMFEVCKPDALVYCAISERNLENYATYLGILLKAIDSGVKQVIIVTIKPFSQLMKGKISSLLEVEELAIILATQVMADNNGFTYKVVSQNDNLLKEIKKFLGK